MDTMRPPSRFHYLLVTANNLEMEQTINVFFPREEPPAFCGFDRLGETSYNWRYFKCANKDDVSIALMQFDNQKEFLYILKELRPYHVLIIGAGEGVSRINKPLEKGDIVVSDYFHHGTIVHYPQANGTRIAILRPDNTLQPSKSLLTTAKAICKEGLTDPDWSLFTKSKTYKTPKIRFGHYYSHNKESIEPPPLDEIDVATGDKIKLEIDRKQELPPSWKKEIDIHCIVNQLRDVLLCDNNSAGIGVVLLNLSRDYEAGNSWLTEFLSIKALSNVAIIESEWVDGVRSWLSRAKRDASKKHNHNGNKFEWEKFAANSSARYACHLINQHGKGLKRQAHITRFAPEGIKDFIDYGCSGVIRTIELIDYSKIAKYHLDKIAHTNSELYNKDIKGRSRKGFFLMWPIEPNMLWEFAMTKYSKSDAAKELIELRTYLPVAEIISNSYFSDLANLIHNEYTHFKHFSDYAKEAMKLGIEQHHFSRLIVLNSSDNWTITDETKLGLELIKLLNGHLDCWVGYKNVVKERTKILTDYVYFCDGTIMDYYEESCTLIVNDLDHSHKDQFNFSEFSESVTDGKIRNIIKLDQFQRENNL